MKTFCSTAFSSALLLIVPSMQTSFAQSNGAGQEANASTEREDPTTDAFDLVSTFVWAIDPSQTNEKQLSDLIGAAKNSGMRTDAIQYTDGVLLAIDEEQAHAAIKAAGLDAKSFAVEPNLTVYPFASLESGCVDAAQPYSPQTLPWGVKRVKVTMAHGTYGGAAAAWIVDTGIADVHGSELNVTSRLFCTAASCVTAAGKQKRDLVGHGTFIAGIVGAVDNGVGVIGVAPSAPLNAVRVFGKKSETKAARFLTALTWIRDHVVSDASPSTPSPGDVVNLSLGMDWVPGNKTQEKIEGMATEIADKGLSVSIAAGNIDALQGKSGYVQTVSPARAGGYQSKLVDGRSVVTASAIREQTGGSWSDNLFWDYSAFGNFTRTQQQVQGKGPPDFAEPGEAIVSLWNEADELASCSGTSFAAAHLTGILLWGPPIAAGRAQEDPSAEIPGSFPDAAYDMNLLDVIGGH